MRRSAGIFVVFLLLAAVYTWPLLAHLTDRIAADVGDPVLNASILWWNAITVPFSETWWNPPYFHLARGVSAFTENLVGISIVASPIFWLTGNPLTTYNFVFYLSWPLCAFSAFLLAKFITKRDDAAFIAGVAFGFAVYRVTEFAHLQMLWSWGIVLALLGLHGYLEQRRIRWLVLFGAAWLVQSLANGYLMIYGGVFIGLWLLYFCSTRASWRSGLAAVAAWAVASLPLVPVMMRYQAVHEQYGLRREMSDLVGFSTPFSSWFQVPGILRLWNRLPQTGLQELFPGLTALTLIAVAFLVTKNRQAPSGAVESTFKRRLYRVLVVAGIASLIALAWMAIVGPVRIEWAGMALRMASPDRAAVVLILCALSLLYMTPTTREALARRSSTSFYLAAILVAALLSSGPVLVLSDKLHIHHAPYSWLMLLPGFDQLRVPARFWMVGVLALAISAAMAYARLPLHRPRLRATVLAVATACLIGEAWMRELPVPPAPALWPQVESRDRSLPLIEIPLGPEWDAAATYRSIWHRRGVFNGVSGYDPAHYAPLQDGLNAHDPMMLPAIASFGAFDVVVNGAADPDGEWARYVSSTPGIQQIATDGSRTLYSMPARQPHDSVGAVLPIASIRGSRKGVELAVDGRIDTHWREEAQRPGQWVTLDLGAVRDVGGVTVAQGEFSWDFPRLLTIELSLDTHGWDEAWLGPTAAFAFRAAAVGPTQTAMHFTFPPRKARYVRLRQLETHKNLWRIAEIRVHAPAPDRALIEQAPTPIPPTTGW